jgi:hypothetical protein
MEGLNALEKAVLDMLLAGDHPMLAVLRIQAARGRLASRELSGVGFFCRFKFPADDPTPVHRGGFHIGDVNADLAGLKHGAGFVLFVREGRLDMLEGYSYDEPWPASLGTFTLSYQDEPRELSLPSPFAAS